MITITQKCDGCGQERDLPWKKFINNLDVEEIARSLGWKQPGQTKSVDVCPDCQSKALSYIGVLAKSF